MANQFPAVIVDESMPADSWALRKVPKCNAGAGLKSPFDLQGVHRFDFTGRLELSTWNSRKGWEPIKGTLWAGSLEEACIQLRGWITAAAKGKTAYYIVNIGGGVVRDSAGPQG